MTLTRRKTHRHTYGDYLTWPDYPREELIDGIAYVKEPPAPSRIHQELVGELHLQIRSALEGKSFRLYLAPFDVRLPKSDEPDEEVDTVVQPDLVIVGDPGKLDERGMRGAPDWIAEVLSPSTARHDQLRKVPVYERSGVAEVWLIHPIDRTVTLYRLDGGRYGPPSVLELRGQTTLVAVPGVSVNWDRVLSHLLP